MWFEVKGIISQSLNKWLIRIIPLPIKLRASENWDQEIWKWATDHREKGYATESINKALKFSYVLSRTKERSFVQR